MIIGLLFPWLIVGLFAVLGSWIGFQLVHQNGRLLSRLEALEQRLGAGAGAAPALAPGLAPAPTPAPQPVPASPSGLPTGTPAPAFELPALSGGRKTLSEFRGQELLLIFFNPR